MPKFPFTNYHELNLDWILKKVNALFDASEENARTIRTYDTRLNSAEQTATSAATAATSAQQLADAAAANADNALSVAGTADQKADSALTAATDASSAVSVALTAAQEAQQTAGAAVATANDAAATASGLESLANTANQNATAAVETAGTAVTRADNAAAAAQTADQKAVAAQQTANSAQTAANTNAGNISTLQSDVSELNRQVSDVEDAIFDNTNLVKFSDTGFVKNGVTCVLEHGRISLNGSATGSITIENFLDLSGLKPSTTYAIRLFNATSSRLDNSQAIYMRNGTTNIATVYFGSGGRNGITFTTPEDTSNLNARLYIGGSASFTNDHIDLMMVESNSIPTEFIAPKTVLFATKEEFENAEININNIDSSLSALNYFTKSAISNNILYKKDTITVTGGGNYVEHKVEIPVTEKTPVTVEIGIVENGTATDKAIIYKKNSAGTESGGTWVRKTSNDHYIGTINIDNDTVSVVIDYYPAQGTPLPTGSAIYHDVIAYQGNKYTKVYSDNYYPVPDYYESHIAEKIETINNYMNNFSANGDAYIFVTDQHWNFNQQNSISLIQEISKKTNIPLLVTGGDVRDYGSFEYCKALRSVFNGEIHNVAGNHDYFFVSGENADDKLYNLFDTYAHNQRTTNPGRHYYYWDDERKKIRYIVLSAFAKGTSAADIVTNGYEEEQLTWFTSTLSNVLEGWEAVVFTHYLYDINWDTDALFLKTYSTPFVTAIDNSGKVAYVMQGHSHRDRITHTPGGVPVIITTCDKNIPYLQPNGTADINVDRSSLTVNEQAFDVVIIDRSTKTIHAVRIGAKALNGIDDEAGTPVDERVITYN